MKKIEYEFTRQKLMPGFDGKTCKVIPSISTDGKTTLLTYSMNSLQGSDVTVDFFMAKSSDGGRSFSEPVAQSCLSDTYDNGLRRTYSASPYYNKSLKKWYGIGLSSVYANDKAPVSINSIATVKPIYCDVDEENCQMTNCRFLDFPFEYVSAYCMGQVVELDGGDILVPFNFTTKDNNRFMVVTIRYTFTGDGLKIVKSGEPLVANQYNRGIYEPSLAKLNGKYYLTLRTDEVGVYAVSGDGYNFSETKPYVWDDGSVLENYNTQQHWVINKDGLFLAYTRKGAHNDHVFRHRAPIFMTRFDEERECLIRDEEIILVPELGARLGNFWATEPNDDEAWVITAEWMQSWGEKTGICEKYGSDNSLWLARVYWEK